MPDLNEAGPDETTALDPTDSVNRAMWVNSAGQKIQTNVNTRIDFDGDGQLLNPGGGVNLNTSGTNGRPVACTNNDVDSTLTGWDDWSNIIMNFRHFGDAEDGPINPTDEPHPSRDALEEMHEEANTTDLSITKPVAVDVIQAGWDKIRYSIVVTNLGPNPADYVIIEDVLAPGTTLQSTSLPCAETAPGQLRCDVGSLLPTDSRNLAITTLTDAEITYDAIESISNDITTDNEAGPDPDDTNNAASATSRVIPVTALWYGLPETSVHATDQFGSIDFELYTPDGLLTPASIDLTQASFFDGVHLMSYPIKIVSWDPALDDLLLENRFGEFHVETTSTPHHLLVPTTKDLQRFPRPPNRWN